MTKTRTEFAETLKQRWPGAMVIEADRGMYVVVGSAEVALAIETAAREAGLAPKGIDQRGPEDFQIRIFGFARGRR
jgi:hypothetical protein